jgi:cytosine/adenosine deaminase-related metal-dependent hydrolase
MGLVVACQPPATDDDSGESGSEGDSQGDPEVIECEAHPLPMVAGGGCEVTTMGANGLRLRGTVLGEDGVLRGGEVLLRSDGRVTCVDCDCSDTAGAEGVTVVDCGDAVISPGLINPHDHITYANNAPIGDGVDRYEHRHDWRTGANGHEEIQYNGDATRDEILGAELRFVMSGTTSTAGAGGENGLLRNLDAGGKLEGLTIPTADSDTFPLDDASGQTNEQGCNYGGDPTRATDIVGHAYLPHIAEGIDAAAANEFTCTSSSGPNNLIGPTTALIHGIALQPVDYAEMTQAGAMLVWSPRSNIVLYGNTAPVTAMDAVGLRIALGTDWVSSGSMNMLRELRCADSLNRDHFGGHFTDREIWEMATVNAARATGAQDLLGVLAPGAVGDIAVFRRGSGDDDHRAVIDAEVDDVVLVLRSGVPLYGDDALLTGLGAGDCEPFDVCGTGKRACVERDTNATLGGVRTAIEQSYPLFFCGVPDDEPTCVPSRPGEYAGPVSGDGDGDGVADGDDICPDVFDPIRAFEQAQGDADGDGVGDACDLCPLDDADGCVG